ncbi:hypothetical protein YPPY48_2609, partial [Yersinia pestis PY-48]
MFNRRGLTMQ